MAKSYTDAELDALEDAAQRYEQRELAELDAYLRPRLRKLSLADLRVVCRSVGCTIYRDCPEMAHYSINAQKQEIVEFLLEVYMYEICAMMCRK